MSVFSSIIPLLLTIFVVTGSCFTAQAEEIIVHGTGYPPIKAENRVQALLMAKRAAVLNGYAAALSQQSGNSNAVISADHAYYDYLSGFVRAMEVVDESYYADGRVVVVLKGDGVAVKVNNMIRTSLPANKPAFAAPATIKHNYPAQVSRQEWFIIIDKIVDFKS